MPLDKQALPPPVQKAVVPVSVKSPKPPKPSTTTRRPRSQDEAEVDPNENDAPKLVLPEHTVPVPASDNE